MDIAKYIGLYLLKNNFCYIHGLGNLELKKKSATHEGQTLSGPQYEVELSLTGSIDDNLANFIATHEQTSISKAANALRDFSIATRAELQAGKEVEIPALGKFTEQNGVIRFMTDPNLQYTPPSIPVLRTAKRVEEAPSFKMVDPAEGEYRGAGMNWSKIGLWAGVLVVIAIILIFGIRYLNSRQSIPAPQETVTAPDTSALTPPVATQHDTAQHDTTAATPPQAPAVAADGQTKVIIGTYTSRVAAERRVKTLTGNGNTVELIAKDSTNYLVLMPIHIQPADSARALDSLRRMFNPKGVSIYH